jgi:heat shock protein HslJ
MYFAKQQLQLQLQRPFRLAQYRPFAWLFTLLLTAILVACAPPTGEPGVETLPTDTPPTDTSDTDDREVAIDWAIADLTGGPVWQLVEYGPAGELTAVLPTTTITLNFDEEGQLFGSAGCNQYSGGYELDGRSLTIGPLASTRMACLEEGIMAQETAFLQALEAAHSVSLIEDRLTISYEGGELHFVPQAEPEALPLEGTEWHLETAVQTEGDMVSALPVPGDLDVTLQLNDGELGGFNGCNSYGGSYTLADGELQTGELFQTLMACLDEIPNEIESQMMRGLQQIESYDITGNRLTITYPGGELIFVGN